MYGLVNKAVCDFITANFGEETWEKIAEKAGTDESFISMEQYPDDETYALVKVISEELKMEPAAVLETFGEFWVTFTGQEGYGPIMKMTGNNVRDFLANLDDMHSRIKANMPELQPPSFEVTDDKDGELTLHYKSNRAGLAPMVLGLLKGVGKLFNTEVQAKHVETRSENPWHEVYHVKYS